MKNKNINILKKISVLYVEDNPEILEELKIFLSRFVGRLHVAGNGEEGLKLFIEHRPDIVVTDLRMPVMDGMKMSQKIKEISPDTPIIVTTAHNESGYLLNAIELGLDNYILKPVDTELFLEALKKSAQILFLKKEKESQNRELRFVLDLNPEFIMLATESSIEYINKTFLNFLGQNSPENFMQYRNNLEGCFVQMGNLPCMEVDKDWRSKIIQEPDMHHTVCLCPQGKSGKTDVEPRLYSVKCNAIPETEKYIFSFHDITETEKEKEQLKNLAVIDPLTNIPNRHRYNEVIKFEMERSRRYGVPLSLILIDIDHFKKVNDSFGHSTGDSVLIEIAELLRDNVRKIDTPARIGGEEFAIVVPQTFLDQAIALAEKLRSVIENHNFKNVGHVTCSFGVAEKSTKEENFADLFDGADRALYRAKNLGRNRVEAEKTW